MVSYLSVKFELFNHVFFKILNSWRETEFITVQSSVKFSFVEIPKMSFFGSGICFALYRDHVVFLQNVFCRGQIKECGLQYEVWIVLYASGHHIQKT